MFFFNEQYPTVRTYTIGIDREEIILFCNSSSSNSTLTDIKWLLVGTNGSGFPNPVNLHTNMLLQNGPIYSVQCRDVVASVTYC